MAQERFPVMHTEAEWKRILTPVQFNILRQAGTERPGSSPLNKEHRQGRFYCAGCNSVLYSSKDKFESGTGWPSFTRPIAPQVVKTRTDNSLFMVRTEVLCATCGGHLGHVFPDGPKPTGLRYCMNGYGMKFQPGKA
jgi:peptide-methionine (R)-S-oxide reductase